MKNENKPYKIFFAHSGGGQSGPGEGSYDLVAYLRVLSDDFEVHFPLIDDPEDPTYDMWQKMPLFHLNIKTFTNVHFQKQRSES